MKRKGKLVVNQKLGDIDGHNETGSPYWEYASNHSKRENSGEIMENPFANPDSLADDPSNQLWGRGQAPELAGAIIESFMDNDGNFPVLSKKENEILKLYTATGDMNIVCKESRLSRSSVNTYMARIRLKFLKLLPALDF